MVFWSLLAAVGSVLGGLVLLFGMLSSQSAPQEAAIAALAVAVAVIPYVFARAVQMAGEAGRHDRHTREIVQAIEALHGKQTPPPTRAEAPQRTGLGSSSPIPQPPPG